MYKAYFDPCTTINDNGHQARREGEGKRPEGKISPGCHDVWRPRRR